MEGAEAGEVAPACNVPVPDGPLGRGKTPRGKEEFGYTPVFLAKSAEAVEK